MANHLYYGDNLAVLREHIRDESVDLIYLDPPFNSNATYNVLFRGPSGDASQAQIEAFEDTWHWNNAAEMAFDEVMFGPNADVADMLRAMRSFLKDNDMMAYLTHMAVRLVELHRVLKPTGSIYLHCDPTASHYLKVLMDAVFGADKYLTEIIWKRSSAHNDAKQGRSQHGRIHDTIFFYAKSASWTWNWQFTPYDQGYIDSFYRHIEEGTGRRYRLGDLTGPGGAEKGNPMYDVMGVRRYWRYSQEKMAQLISQGRVVQTRPGAVPAYKRYLDEMPGVPIQDIWTDVAPIGAQAQERLGYPTQKPVALLERILSASSNPGDVVLDPFCGCGTTIHAAEKLGRQWIGIDITHLAISLIEKRIKDAFPGIGFTVHGAPKDLEGARDLSNRDKYQFQWWAVSLVDAVPFGGKKKGADGGIDGHIFFRSGAKTVEKAIVSVKGGGIGVKDIRELIAVVDRERAKIGVYISLEPHTEPMVREAASAGLYDGPTGKVPKIQLFTIEELFAGKKPQIPLMERGFKSAAREARDDQSELDI
ncbi:MAG: site-specific DNA-methyltransferase [Hyphomicrobiaceae bacterium]|nr:site-specific DNA-methyltransferase [Hyphomicrobiaceae bacterium]